MITLDWSPQQAKAISDIQEWLNGKPAFGRIYRLSGYAGTGKSTLVTHLAQTIKIKTRVAALTGKAAQVLRSKGCPTACTIHSMIYRSMDKSLEARDEMKKELKALIEGKAPKKTITALERKIKTLNQELQSPNFIRNPDAFEEDRPSLIIIDESSMVDKYVGEDLISFGIPILSVGDPAQLPPIYGEGYFTGAKADTMLTEIHRQAEGNPIIGLATKIRNGEWPKIGRYGESRITSRMPEEPWTTFDQILVGRHVTRRAINRDARVALGYVHGMLPEPGEKVICCRNNHDIGLLNGTMWEVIKCEARYDDDPFFRMEAKPLDVPNPVARVIEKVHKKPFHGEDFEDWRERNLANEFDYGYAITVHKAQGSQWENVFVVDESRVFRNSARNWLYTAVTRAIDKLTVVRQ